MAIKLRPRKVYDLNGSLGITLPKEWIYDQSIRPGQLVNVIILEEGSLVLTTSNHYRGSMRFEGKRVVIWTVSGFKYTGEVVGTDDESITLIDRKDHKPRTLMKSSLRSIEEE